MSKRKRKQKSHHQSHQPRPRSEFKRKVAIILIASMTLGVFGGLTIPGTTSPATIQPAAPLIGPEAPAESPANTSPPSLTWKEAVQIQSDVEIYEMIHVAAIEAGVDPLVAVRIAECESQLDPFAKNPNSTAKGLYQFLDSTWANIGATGSPYNVEENINQFMEWYPRHPEWWVCK